jgi:hypothetical protein
MSKVCQSVQGMENGFKHCVNLLKDDETDTPAMPLNISRLCKDRAHFLNNEYLVTVLKPIVDTIGRLESENTTLADIWVEVIRCYTSINKVDLPAAFQSIKKQAIRSVAQRVEGFKKPIYFVAFFLNPKYRSVAVSREITIQYIKQEILNILKAWEYTRPMVANCMTALNMYYNNEGIFQLHASIADPLVYWISMSKQEPVCKFRNFAINILQLKPSSVGLEQLFSMMKYKKPKHRNRIKVDQLSGLTLIKSSLMDETKKSKSRKRLIDDTDKLTADIVTMLSFDELSSNINDYEIYFAEEDFPETNSRQDAFMESLFDFEAFQNIQNGATSETKATKIILGATNDWDPSDFLC